MELNSNTNPLFKQGTVLPKGKGGLSKSGGGLEIGTSNPLGIKTFKSHKVWKVEDFEVEKKVVKTEGKSDSEDSEDESLSDDSEKGSRQKPKTPVIRLTEMGKHRYPAVSLQQSNQPVGPSYKTPNTKTLTTGGLPTGMTPTVLKLPLRTNVGELSGRSLDNVFGLRSSSDY